MYLWLKVCIPLSYQGCDENKNKALTKYLLWCLIITNKIRFYTAHSINNFTSSST
jgi:hypothetical protein